MLVNRLLPGRRTTRAAARRRVSLVVMSVIALVASGVGLLLPPSATAAGDGVLNIVVTPIDLSDGSTITDIEDGAHANKVTYRVQYSCTTAACDGTQVQFTTPPADPWGLLPAGQTILQYSSWVAPASGGGTIGGTDATGKVVSLGDLSAGTSGTFSVTYGFQASRNREVPNGSFYPEGTVVPMSATISSDTATAPKTSDTQITWHIGTPVNPSANLAPLNGTFDTDVQETFSIAVNPGNMLTNPGANVAGAASYVATGNYRIVYTVPAEAVIDEVSHGGVIDNANHTVTWTKGSPASPSYGARGGWGLAALGGFNSGGAASNNTLVGDDDDAFWGPRTVKVRFLGENFPEADANGCNFTQSVTSTLDVTVNYLDDPRTQRTLNRTQTNKVACTTPFGGISSGKSFVNGATSFGGDGDLGSGVFALNVPAPGETDTASREWRVSVANLGNVDATAVIDEPNLDQDHIKVHRIYAYAYAGAPSGWEATVTWVDNTGATGTAPLGSLGFVDAQPGRWFVSARATAPLAAGRILPGDVTQTQMQMGYRFRVDDGAIPLIGEERTNTADVSLSYPTDADGDGSPDDYVNISGQPLPTRQVEAQSSRTVRYTQPLGSLVPGNVSAPVVAGGGTPVPGTEVTFRVRAVTSNVWPGTSIQPQLVFIAPENWEVVPDSASFTAAGTGPTATVPAGVTYDYRTVTLAGVQRSVVVATFPSSVALSSATNDYWPTLDVIARPTLSAVPGVTPSTTVWAGDQSENWTDATGNAFVSGPNQFRVSALAGDAPDVDGDGNTTEEYSALTTAYPNLAVAASDGLTIVKSLCVPDEEAADGCAWVSDASQVHEIPATGSTVKYRLTLTNGGNTALQDVVAYDVLPHLGDTGLLADPLPRGSEFDLLVDSVESSTANVDLAYSASTNPARPEVNPGAAGTVDDWGPGANGKKAIRMTVDGGLAAGGTASVVFVASVAPGSPANKVACNTVAVDSAATLPVEPLPVCVTRAAGEPALETTKTAELTTDNGAAGIADEGDVITYTITVANTGNVPVTDVAVTDELPGLSAMTPASVATLAPGEDEDFTATYTVTQADVDTGGVLRNTATAAGTGPEGPVTSPPASVDVTVVAATPELLTDKEAELDDTNGNGVADKGEKISYTFTVRNTGNVTVEDVVVDDPMVSDISPASASIAPGDSQVFTADDYTVTQADVDGGGPIVNRASATGSDPDGGEVTSPEDTTSTDTVTRAPGLSIEKSAEITTDDGQSDKADEGDVITYTFEVTNTGNVTMANVRVEDALPGLSPTSPLQVATLAPDADATFTATYTVTQADVDAGEPVHNSAVATGSGPAGAPTTSAPDTTDTDVADAETGLAMDKTAVLDDTNGNGSADRGEVIAYSFTVENTGNVTLTGVSVTDPMPGLTAITPADVASLAPGDDAVFTASYTVTQADVDAGEPVRNSATAAGTAPDDTSVGSEPDTTETDVVEGAPGIVLDKSSELEDINGNGRADVGEEITYTFEVENTGNVTATDVSVTDPEVEGITPASAAVAPGDVATFTADPYVVTQGDVDDGVVHNVAAATGTVPGGAEVRSEDVDDVDTIEAHPDVTIEKTAELSVDDHTVGVADVDDVVTYTFTVRNDGLATAFDVVVTDELPGLSTVSPAGVTSLAPGAEAEFTATYRVTRADVKRGEIENVALVGYRGPARDGEIPGQQTVDSNEVTTVTGGLGAPTITTQVPRRTVAMTVASSGAPNAVRLYDVVTIRGFQAGGDAQGTATLYGPVPRRSTSMCVPARAVATVRFTPRNGTFRTASVPVSKPGYYTWVVRTGEDRRNDASAHACGLVSETALVHRSSYGNLGIETGYTGTAPSAAGASDRLTRRSRPAQVSIPALGMRARLDTVGTRKGSMVIPSNVARGGWLRQSALPGERVGSTVIAGHVSDRRDRPGVFGKLRKARKGQVVSVQAADGSVQRYRIARVYTQPRTRGFSGSTVSTTGSHRLTLVTCTGRVTYRNGRFHYTKNLVVIATPIK